MTNQTPFPQLSGVGSSALAKAIGQMSDRGLGDLPVRSNLLNVSEKLAVSRAADNLLAKAARAMTAGDRPRAEHYVDRALQLPFDEMAEAEAALQAAHMAVHRTVTDAVERSDQGDVTWLDAAEAALPRCGVHAREDLLEVLRVVANDYRLEREEIRRIRRIAPGDGLVRGIGDIMLTRTGADQATVRQIVLDILDALVVLQHEIATRRAPTRAL